MDNSARFQRKVFNDPIYGFISVPYEILFRIVEHPYFQRLRRITQLGLTNLVYPGANHTRFQHTLGAVHLMTQAIEVMRSKGIEITEDEAIGVTAAILLHDIGHGPYSHTLEQSIVQGISHESISSLFMEALNNELDGALDTGIAIFNDAYPKKFLHQLVSSQLDMDRLDYLKRDSFFTGVSEGVVGSERIIKMLTVANGELAVERKGIYSIEKFLIARRLMYWQVYLHKTVLGGEYLLMNILSRAKSLSAEGTELFASPSLRVFLKGNYKRVDFIKNRQLLDAFAQLDDYDILGAIKAWSNNDDFILSTLCKRLLNRELLRVKIQNHPFPKEEIDHIRETLARTTGISLEETHYLVYSDQVTNRAYSQEMAKINIVHKDGSVIDIAEDADLISIAALSHPVKKYFLCYPKNL